LLKSGRLLLFFGFRLVDESILGILFICLFKGANVPFQFESLLQQANGDVIAVRYVDDAVFGFQYENEALAFLEALREQLAAHGLNLHPKKTRLIEFGRFASPNRKNRGEGKPESFDFLGFTHSCGKTRNGKFKVRRVTIAKRMTRKLCEIKKELRVRMHDPLSKTGKWLASILRGAYQYYAIIPIQARDLTPNTQGRSRMR
jgi:hypothetical protein